MKAKICSLILLLCFCLAACGSEKIDDTQEKTIEITTETTTEKVMEKETETEVVTEAMTEKTEGETTEEKTEEQKEEVDYSPYYEIIQKVEDIDPENITDDFMYPRHNITGYKGCLSLSRRIERTDSYKSVNSRLGLQISICMIPVNLESHGLDTRFISVQEVQLFNCKAVLIGPACIHSVKHTRPIAGLGSAGTGMKRNNRIALVKFARKKRLNSECFKLLLKCFEHLSGFCNQLFVSRLILCHLYHSPDIIIFGTDGLELFDVIL